MTLEIGRRWNALTSRWETKPAEEVSLPVSCVLYPDAHIDIHDQGLHVINWGSYVENNRFDAVQLPGLPDGIGFTNPLDDSSDDLEFTEGGTWVFQLISTGSQSVDDTLRATIQHQLIGAIEGWEPGDSGSGTGQGFVATSVATLADPQTSPAFQIITLDVATADPYYIQPAMICTRIA